MHSLYRYFSETDELLYVGVSHSPVVRFGQHGRDKDVTQVCHIEIEWFETRLDAEAAEAWAIVRERPKWNKVGKRRPRALKRSPKRALEPQSVVESVIDEALISAPAVDGDLRLEGWSKFIGPPVPYYFIALTDREPRDDANEWRYISPSKATCLINYIRPGDMIWYDGDAQDGFWEKVAERRAYRCSNHGCATR